jgi:hypothetical protein
MANTEAPGGSPRRPEPDDHAAGLAGARTATFRCWTVPAGQLVLAQLWGEVDARITAGPLTSLVRGSDNSGTRLRSCAIWAAGSRHVRPGADGRGVSGMPIVACG